MPKSKILPNIVNIFPFVIGISLAAALLVLLIAASIFGYYSYLRFTHRVLPGVTIAGEKAGTLSHSQLASRLDNHWRKDKLILVTDGIHQEYLAPEDLGLYFDLEETSSIALSVGRGENGFVNIIEPIDVFLNSVDIPIFVSLDIEQARSGLESLTPIMNLAPTEAKVEVMGDSLVAIPGNYGYTINIEETIDKLAHEGKSIFESGFLEVQIKPVLPRITDVSQALEEGEKLLATPVEISAYDPISNEHISWVVSRDDIAQWIVVEKSELRPILRLNQDRIAEYLSEKGRSLGADRIIDGPAFAGEVVQAVETEQIANVIVSHLPTTYTVQPGDTLLKIGWQLGFPFWMIQNQNPGINPDALVVGDKLIVPSKDELIPFPIIPNKRIVISIGEQKLRTYVNGDLNSTHIISTGMDRSPTQPGVFQVQTHELNAYASVWDLTMPHFLGIYEAWPGFMNGIHGLPTLSNGRRLWANVLGKPASYGCIILDLDDAEWLYNWAEQGVVVEITP